MTSKESSGELLFDLLFSVFSVSRGSAICFAFGQTGAGKTHTLMGSRTIPGMYQLAGEDLFAIAHSGRYREPLRLWVSFYEIYCGHLYDLLNKRKRFVSYYHHHHYYHSLLILSSGDEQDFGSPGNLYSFVLAKPALVFC